MSTTKQRQQIGYMRKLIGLDEELYREMLTNHCNVSSAKDLTDKQAKYFLNILRDKAKELGVFKPKLQYSFQKNKYNTLEARENMASPAQLRKIEAMWFQVSKAQTDDAREKALKTFVKKITGKDHLKFLTPKDVSKLIKALTAMVNKQNDINKK